MTDTIDKNKKLSFWNLALQQFNKDRNPGSKFLMPKKDTPEYFKVKEISDRLKQESSNSTTFVEKKKVVRKKKEKSNEVVPTDSVSTEVVTKPKKTRKKKDVVNPIPSDAQTV
jgi:hypothetical protein